MDELDELIEFLGHQAPQIRQHALDLVQGLTGSPDGVAQLASRATTLVPPLFRAASATEPSISRSALTSLVNLSQEPVIQQKLLDLNAPARCMDYLREGTCVGREELVIMLLANLTAAEEGAAALLQLDKEGLEGLNLAILIQRFLQPSSTEDTFAHVATVLPNVTKLKAGRRVLLEPGRGTLSALASQLRSANKLRRRGCAGAIKNCCFSCEDDGNVDAIAVEKEALAEILAVLADTESRAAKDEIVRENLADAVLCLAKVPSARKKLWEANAPELLKKAYEFEEHAGTCEAMESAAALFLEDGFVPQGEDEVKEDDLVLPASETRTSSVHIEEID